MAKRSSRRGGGSRKRSEAPVKAAAGSKLPASAANAGANAGGDGDAKRKPAKGESAKRAPAPNERAARRQRSGGRESEAAIRAPGAVGERPQAPWHPLPLSELLILVGMIGSIVGFSRGKSGTTVLFAGIGAVMLGTLEFTIREHLSGYRSHASLLAAIPTALLHGALALTLFALGAPNASLVIAPLVLDVPVFAFLFKALRARFADARRERVFAGGR